MDEYLYFCQKNKKNIQLFYRILFFYIKKRFHSYVRRTITSTGLFCSGGHSHSRERHEIKR